MKTKLLSLLLVLLIPCFVNAQESEEEFLENKSGGFVTLPNSEYSEESQNETEEQFKVYNKVDVKEFALPECKDVPIYLDKCLPSMCQDTTPFGKILRKLKGKNSEGGCEYVERTPGFGGQDCTFSSNNIAETNRLFYGFNFAADDEPKLSNNEIEDYKFLMKESCKSVKDTSDIDDIGFDTQPQLEVKPEVIEPEVAEVVTETEAPKVVEKPDIGEDLSIEETPQIIEEKPVVDTTLPLPGVPDKEESASNNDEQEVAATEEEVESVDDYEIKSVMFTENEIDQINDILGGFSIIQQKATDLQPKEEEKSTRNFYLKSIIYYSKKKWAVWINDLKISGATEGGLVVQEIAKNYAIIQWSTPSLSKISPNWKQLLTAVSDDTYVSEKNDIQVYLPDPETAIISFKISPNQTFEAGNMRIKEGKG